jgi:hypothetical protein
MRSPHGGYSHWQKRKRSTPTSPRVRLATEDGQKAPRKKDDQVFCKRLPLAAPQRGKCHRDVLMVRLWPHRNDAAEANLAIREIIRGALRRDFR